MASCLSHLKILDLSRVFAGPWCTQMFADLGADVVKVEHPIGGDDVRHMGSMLNDPDGQPTGETSSYLAMNRGKRSLALDISTPQGQDIIRRLADASDIFIENFKTGAMKRYGLDFETLSARNPRLVYCSITGFGQTGPDRNLPGYDAIFQAMSGLMSVTGTADGEPGAGPSLVGYSVSDINAGLYAAIAILAALNHRDNVSGRGQHIDLALLDAQIASISHIAMNYFVSGKMPVRAGASSQINCPWQTFECLDRPLMVTVGNNRQFENLMAALGQPDIAKDPRFAVNRERLKNRGALLDILVPLFRTKKAREWMDALNAVGVPSGPINDFQQLREDPQVQHRKMFDELDHPLSGRLPIVTNPIRLSETPPTYSRPPPLHGQHGPEVLAERLGFGKAEMELLAASGVLKLPDQSD